MTPRARRLSAALFAVASLLVAAAANVVASAQETSTAQAATAEARLVVHYHRPDARYEGWDLWVWPEGGDGRSHRFEGRDDFGVSAVIPWPSPPARAGFIVRRGNWEAKDVDIDRFVRLEPGATTEIWLISGQDTIHTDAAAIDLSLRVVGAFLDDLDVITLATSVPLDAGQLSAIEVVDVAAPTTRLGVASARTAEPSGGASIAEITLERPVAPASIGSLALRFPPPFEGLAERRVLARDVLDGAAFQAIGAELGPRCDGGSTRFATWSPVAERVDLLLGDPAGASIRTIPLARDARGVWHASVEGDLHGVPYRYRFRTYGEDHVAADMHCLAATADSSASVVVDFDRLGGADDGVAPFPRLGDPTDEIVYEVHVRDYSIRDPSCPESLRGTYLGLVSERGLAYLTELGVTAVHLLPVHDFAARRDEYNWGYWTTLFNVPESNYASVADDPLAPLRELRVAIDRLHAAGIRVILDVVYNHASSTGPDSPFGAAVPHYFFRTTRDGRLVNDTGVGNTVADERPMVRKFILDSLRHWLDRYGVDGFRFDLVGCHEPDTVRALCQALPELRPDITLYGEPWTGGGRVRFPKGAQRGLPFAVFNDHLRNAVRGDLDGTAIGFATGPGGDLAAVQLGVAGAIDDFASEPRESVSYVSAHDNLTLWDKIVRTQPDASDAERRAMQRLALGIVLTSQGLAFLHGGCEFCRTKGGRHNTFDAGDDVNHFDWTRREAYDDVVDYVAGLIRLRRAHPAFTMADDALVRQSLRFLPRDPSDGRRRPLAFTLDGTASRDPWPLILVAYNDEPSEATLAVPEGDWSVVVDARTAGIEELRTIRGTTSLPPYSMVVAYQVAPQVAPQGPGTRPAGQN